jgi:hypothetical protein
LPASSNISDWSRSAVSHVGCRLMVASRAKINRPRSPLRVVGATARASARNASISLDFGRVDDGRGPFTGVCLESATFSTYARAQMPARSR